MWPMGAAAAGAARGAPKAVRPTTAKARLTTTITLRMTTSRRSGLDPGAFCAQARLLIVAGKGGVGKTTVTATLARMAARAGLDALIIDMEGKSGLGNIFG